MRCTSSLILSAEGASASGDGDALTGGLSSITTVLTSLVSELTSLAGTTTGGSGLGSITDITSLLSPLLSVSTRSFYP